jgi:tetratricopeptide (TPR) repeat protein
MDNDDFDFLEDQEITDALKRYEKMLITRELSYFDVIELEHIIDFYIDEAKLNEALELVEFGMKQHPGSFALLSKKAGLLYYLGKTQETYELVEELLKVETKNPDLLFLKGSSLLVLGHGGSASMAFKEALENAFDNKDEFYFNIGMGYENTGNYSEAITYYLQAHNAYPDFDSVLFELAYCYEKIGEDYKAIEFYNKFLDLDTFSDTAWFNLGIIYNKLGLDKKAAEAYEYALVINEDFASAWFNLGNCYVVLRKYKKAIEALQKYLEFDESNDEMSCVIADCFIQLRKNTDAFNWYQTAITYNKKNHRAWFGSGLIMNIEKDYHAAYKYFRKATNIQEDNPDYWSFLGKVSLKLNLFGETVEAFEKVCQLTPNRITGWLKLSDIYHRSGQNYKAISVLEDALIHHPMNTVIQYRLAAYHLESMNEKVAVKHLKNALSSDFKRHTLLFESFPDAQNMESIRNLILKYKRINS